MPQLMPWGGTYSVLAELLLPTNEFTLNDASLGVLDGNCYLDGRTSDDITDKVQEIRISRGRHDQFQDFQAGIMTLVLTNNDREFDPKNTESRYYDPVTDTSGVTIRRKVTVYYGSTAIFTGRITDIDISYDPTSSPTTRSTVTIDVADDFVLLANAYLDEVLPTSQLSGARVNTILGLPELDYSGPTSISSGTITCLDDPISFGTRALDALQAVAATERGVLVIKGDGTLVFTNRVTGSPTISHFFSDDGVGSEYNALSIVYGQENLYNRVICTPIDSLVPGVADDATSQATFGIAALSVNGLLCSDADAQDLADYLLSLYSLPSYRFDGLEVQFAGSSVAPAEQQEIIDLDIGSDIRVLKTYAIGNPSTIYQNVTIEHIEHVITTQSHTISYKLAPSSFTTFTKTATGSGVSSQTATAIEIIGKTASGTGGATAGDSATGVRIVLRTALNSASGTQSAAGLRTVDRTATGTGTGTQSASAIEIIDRTATNSGTGTQSAIGVRIVLRTATNSGTGTQTATGLRTVYRTATGSGAGTQTATSGKIVDRTATGSGAGTQSASRDVVFVMILNDATRGLLAGFPVATTRTNLLPDPNMENASIATYWQAIKITESRSTDFVYSGTYAMKGVIDVGTAGQYFQVLQTAGAMIDVVAGQTYTFSAYIYLPASNTADTRWRANLYFWNGTSYTGANAGTTTTVTRGDWTRLTTTATVPAGYYKALPRIAAFDTLAVGQEAYVDAWLLEEGSSLLPYFDGTYVNDYTGYGLYSKAWNGTENASTSTASWYLGNTRTNLIKNPNFEANATGWAFAAMSGTRITTASYIGSASLQLTSTSASDVTSRTAYDPNTVIGAGVTLTASCYVYNFAGNNRNHRIDIRCFTSGGGVAGVITGTATAINVGSGWTRLFVTGTTPVNTASIDVAVFIQANNPSLSNVTYLDAIMLETGSTLLPYFDGAYADTYTGYTLTEQGWNGTANASTSTATWGQDSSYITGSTLGY